MNTFMQSIDNNVLSMPIVWCWVWGMV